jgi:hypothetical protein
MLKENIVTGISSVSVGIVSGPSQTPWKLPRVVNSGDWMRPTTNHNFVGNYVSKSALNTSHQSVRLLPSLVMQIVLKSSDSGIYQLVLLDFWTLATLCL